MSRPPSRQLLKNLLLLDPERPEPVRGSLLLDGDRIEAVFEGTSADAAALDAAVRDCAGLELAPGFIDLHFHGELLFADPDDFGGALTRASRALVRGGTTAFLATTVAWQADRLLTYVTQLTHAMTQSRLPGAVAIGLHLEGPWINFEAAGAQPVAGIRSFEPSDADILSACGDQLRMVTLAPEIEGADRLIEALQRDRIIASLGHSLANSEQVDRAASNGLTHVTHLFNAMGPLHHRDPGVPGSALAHETLTADLICDGVHVHPKVVRLAARALGERLVLISDRVDLPPGGVGFGSGALIDDGKAYRLPDGRLAGSTLELARAVRNVCEWAGMTKLAAVSAATLRPARMLGIEAERGTLRPGARADLVLLGPSGHVLETWIGGERVYVSGS